MKFLQSGHQSSRTRAGIPLVLEFGSHAESRQETGPETPWRVESGFAWLLKRRAALAFVSGAVCMLGLLVAFSPTDVKVEEMAPTQPSPTPFVSGVNSDVDALGPREFVESLLANGTLGGESLGLTHPAVAIESRNGDVALLTVTSDQRASSDDEPIQLGVVLVRSEGAWTVRNVYRSHVVDDKGS